MIKYLRIYHLSEKESSKGIKIIIQQNMCGNDPRLLALCRAALHCDYVGCACGLVVHS